MAQIDEDTYAKVVCANCGFRMYHELERLGPFQFPPPPKEDLIRDLRKGLGVQGRRWRVGARAKAVKRERVGRWQSEKRRETD